jgi:hypothetical protein
VGNTLTAAAAGSDLILSWLAVPGAASYQVHRSPFADLGSFDLLSVPGATLTDMSGPASPDAALYYKAFAVSGCGVVSGN